MAAQFAATFARSQTHSLLQLKANLGLFSATQVKPKPRAALHGQWPQDVFASKGDGERDQIEIVARHLSNLSMLGGIGPVPVSAGTGPPIWLRAFQQLPDLQIGLWVPRDRAGGLMSSEQLPLKYNDSYRHEQQGDALLELVREVVAALGLKQVAFDLDVQPSVLAHALAERDRHYPRLRWLPYLVAHAPNDRVVELIASWRNLECKAKVELTPAEKLERIERALETTCGEKMAAFIRKEAGL